MLKTFCLYSLSRIDEEMNMRATQFRNKVKSFIKHIN